MRQGIDYAWGRPSPSVIRADGYDFCCRYLSYDTSGKNLSRSEADSLHAAGIDTVSNWEWYADDALGRAPDGSWISPYQAGVNNAKAALSQHNACGGPSWAPIYFSVDFDATPEQQTPINSYLDGVASVIGRNRTGAYGDFYVLGRAFDAGKITWGWQTYAWSGGQWDSRAQIRQVQNDITVDGVDSDRDQALVNDFGQWGVTGGFLMALNDDQQMQIYHAIVTGDVTSIEDRYFQRAVWGRDVQTDAVDSGGWPSANKILNAVNALHGAANPAKAADAIAAELRTAGVEIDDDKLRTAVQNGLQKMMNDNGNAG